MSVFYTVAYAIGFHPWEDLATHEPFADTLLALIARDETSNGQPNGLALDVGTGSGVWGVKLAERGWDVTGIDPVRKAVRRARKRVAAANVPMKVVRADVCRSLPESVGTGYRLIVDTGTFHGLTDAQRRAMGRTVSAVAAEQATVILDCFSPGRRGPLPRGATEADIEAAFPDWKITDKVVADTDPDSIAVKFKFDEHFYRLRRNIWPTGG